VDRYIRKQEERPTSILEPPRKQSRRRPHLLTLLMGRRKKPEVPQLPGNEPWNRGYRSGASTPIEHKALAKDAKRLVLPL
jgi:hypothetical protein